MKKGGRPSTYKWKEIEQAYKDGLSTNEICELYEVEKKTLQNRISAKKWERTGNINADIQDFKESFGRVSGYVSQNDDTKNQMIIERVSTILEDNNLMINNRKLLKAFQAKILNGLQTGAYEKPSDIKAGTGAIKDIESIANPTTNKTEINNTNAQQTVSEIIIRDA